MLQPTRGIVLRAIKYGDTSLIVTVFTRSFGIQSYIVQGIRSAKAKQQRAGLMQPATLLDMVVYNKPLQNLQRIREFQPAHIYRSLHEEIVKNSIALFSIELLLRLLPEHAPMPEVFDLAFNYLCLLDEEHAGDCANLPLYFIIGISRLLGYEIHGNYSTATPHLDLAEGAFSSSPPRVGSSLQDEDIAALAGLLKTEEPGELKRIALNAAARNRIIDWYIEFLQRHTQHMGAIKSLAVLRAVLH
jgi:DNA repair protein RecO (recombination protein O)